MESVSLDRPFTHCVNELFSFFVFLPIKPTQHLKVFCPTGRKFTKKTFDENTNYKLLDVTA
jgi:hypothetical protein